MIVAAVPLVLAKKSPELERVSAALCCAIALMPLPEVDFLTGAVVAWVFAGPVIVRAFDSAVARVLWVGIAVWAASIPLVTWLLGGDLSVAKIYLAPLAVILSTGTLLWGAAILGWQRSLLLAMPAAIVFDVATRGGYGNIWKYALSVWVVSAVLIAFANRTPRVRLCAVLFLCSISAAFDTRNIVLMLLVVVVFDLAASMADNRWKVRVAALVLPPIALTVALYLALAGAFGASIQQTTAHQARDGLARIPMSARPEASGNLALLMADPWRLSDHTSLTSVEASIIRRSIATAGWDPTSTRVRSEVLASAELHSVAADAWFGLGTMGLALAALVVGIASRSFALLSSGWTPLSGIAAFGAARISWDVLFSPVSDTRAWPVYLVPICLVIARRRELPWPSR